VAAAHPAATSLRRVRPLIRGEDGVRFALQPPAPPSGQLGQTPRPLQRRRITTRRFPALMGGGDLVRQLLERVTPRQEKADPDLVSLF